jgi:hypothetical protein
VSWRDSGETGCLAGWQAYGACTGRVGCGAVTSRVAAALLLLVESLPQWSLNASMVVSDVTDAGISEASIFILLLLGGALMNGYWSCYGDRWLGSACVTVQTASLQVVVYKYCLLLLHCGSWVVCLTVGGPYNSLLCRVNHHSSCSYVRKKF